MNYPEIPLAQSILQLFKAKEIKHIIISPGSRNAPLTIGFTNDPFFTCYSVVDERCAAFFAMGIAQQTQEPAALLCTSGSALLNYYPAVAEAFYSQIRSEEHTSELQSRENLVCRLLLEKKKNAI